LLVGNIRVGLAPDEEDVGKQLEDVTILEECHFLVGAIDILLDFLL
jgi:hypothetical protein